MLPQEITMRNDFHLRHIEQYLFKENFTTYGIAGLRKSFEFLKYDIRDAIARERQRRMMGDAQQQE